MTDEQVEKIIKSNMMLQMNLAGIRADFEEALHRPWVGLMRGVRVDGDTVVISVKGGNDAARELCGALIEEMNT